MSGLVMVFGTVSVQFMYGCRTRGRTEHQKKWNKGTG